MSLRFEKLFACNYLFSKSGTEDYLFFLEFTFLEDSCVDHSPLVPSCNWKYLGKTSKMLLLFLSGSRVNEN